MHAHTGWIIGIALGSAAAGLAADRLLGVRIEPRANPSIAQVAEDLGAARSARLERRSDAADPGAHDAAPGALSLRLVDAGGVGIAPDSIAWTAASYSHGTGAFHSVIRPGSADIDSIALSAVASDWRTYVDRMSRWGANGIIFPAFLELMDFGRVPGPPVYAGSDAYYLARNEHLRDAYGELFGYAARAGIGIYLKTDMVVLTPPLERALRERAGSLDAANPELWAVYAAGLDELFDAMPAVRGVVIRIGEAGALYNADGWEYRSEMTVREPADVRLMLETLLPVFERHGRTLILRSWTVGVGALGALHTDPAVYDAVLGDIDSDALVVSTKFTRGDYFSHLPLNPTLFSGSQRRLIEFQARREFEGFGAFPNYLGDDHASAIRALVAANPNIAGISLWTQEGGPLHAGPMSLYPVHGFWRWIDANVYATLRLALDPYASPTAIARDWVRETVSSDSAVVDRLADILVRSREPVRAGLYVRPFAERDVFALGVASTPLMWIMEWDVVGDWHLVSSALYGASRDQFDEAINEGFEASSTVRGLRREIDALESRPGAGAEIGRMQRSLLYEESLFETLAEWRSALLEYYRWLDTGDRAARERARSSGARFTAAAAEHTAQFGTDLDFPAYDFTPALAALERWDRSDAARRGARMGLLIVAVFLLAGIPLFRRSPSGRAARVGRSMWIGAAAPWRLEPACVVDAWGTGLMATVVILLASVFSLSFGAPRVAGGSLALMATFVFAVKGGWTGITPNRSDGHAVAMLGPLLPLGVAMLALLAVRGPDHLWFQFWTSGWTRALTTTVAAAALLAVLRSVHIAGSRVRGLTQRRSLGTLLVAAGATLVALTLLLPDLPDLLASLDDPLGILPVRTALIVAVTSYVGVSPAILWYPAALGALLIGSGIVFHLTGRTTNT